MGIKGEWELFNLEQDRTEQTNLAAEQPEQVALLAKQWSRWAKDVHAMPKPPAKVKKER